VSKPFTPRPWQPMAIQHIVDNSRCAVWLSMGSGKTLVTLTALEAIEVISGDAYPALVLGPLRVARKVWREEAQKWDHLKHLRVATAIGNPKERLAALDSGAPITAINYDNVDWLVKQYRHKPWPFKTIIADESRKLSAFRIMQGGAMTAALGKVAWLPIVKHFIELTGTPSPNGLRNLWGATWFLDKGTRLGLSYKAFEERWFAYKRITDALGKSHVQSTIQKGADVEIHEKVRDLCMSINLSEWIDVAEPVHVEVKVELPVAARRLYREMERNFFIQIEGHDIEAFHAASKSMKLLQLANGAVYLDPDVENDENPKARAYKVVHDAKIEALQSIIEEVGDEDAPIIVVCQFKSDYTRLLKAVPGSRVLKSEKDEDDFKAGLIPVLLTHPKSAGHGIDGFQNVCNVIVFFGQWWDLELRQQIIERIGPIRQMQAGLDRPVFIYDIIVENSVDEDVMVRHDTKRSVQDILLEATRRRGHG
jgi:SNF2 family DNA or RNA helicase